MANAPLKDDGLHIRLAERELGEISDAADNLNLPRSTWARSVLLREARRILEDGRKPVDIKS